jgi:hypothetical protein
MERFFIIFASRQNTNHMKESYIKPDVLAFSLELEKAVLQPASTEAFGGTNPGEWGPNPFSDTPFAF